MTTIQSILLRYLMVLWLFGPITWLSAHAQALLPSDVLTVDGTSDAVVNITLPSGFLLSGTVRTNRGEPVTPGTLTARSATGVFAGNIVTQGSESVYRVALPAGTYDLNVTVPFLDAEAERPAFIHVSSDVVTALAIASDAEQNLTVSARPALVTVTGFVTAQSAVPAGGGLRLVSLDGGTFAVVPFEDDYTARLPLNTYNVRVDLIFAEVAEGVSPRTTARVTVDLDAVEVNNNPAIYDITLPPTVDLSGTLLDSVGAPAAPARVVAVASEASTTPDEIDLSCRPAITFSLDAMPVSGTAFVQPETGAYRMPLPMGTYRLGVTIGLALQPGLAPAVADLDTSPGGIFHVATSMPEVALTTDLSRNLAVPALPQVVTISGRVTDALGQPVANAIVKAMTSTLTGVTDTVRFLAVAQTGDDGRYTLPVLSGTNYEVRACPPVTAAASPGLP